MSVGQEPSGVTVLVVDDEPAIREIAQLALETAGHSVRLAEDGVEAVEAVDTWGSEIDAVLLDLRMPRLGGLEVLQEIRQRQPELPVIVTSGDLADGLVATENHVGYLQKPFRLGELLESVERALGERCLVG